MHKRHRLGEAVEQRVGEPAAGEGVHGERLAEGGQCGEDAGEERVLVFLGAKREAETEEVEERGEGGVIPVDGLCVDLWVRGRGDTTSWRREEM